MLAKAVVATNNPRNPSGNGDAWDIRPPSAVMPVQMPPGARSLNGNVSAERVVRLGR